MCEVKNTIRFNFSHGNDKPDMGEIVNFVKFLDCDSGQVEAAYRIGEERSIFLKFRSEESMLHALNFNPEDLTFHYANGKTAAVRMSNASEFIEYVRIYDLPPEVPDNELEKVLKKYGKVKRVIREKFPVELNFDAYTGVRGAYMDVKKEIPTSLHFLNRKGNIFYDGNKGKCFLCKAEGHLVLSCPKRKARKQPEQHREDRSATSSYAGVVTGAAAAEIIEVLDEEVMAIEDMTPDSHQETIEVREKEISEAAMAPTAAENSESETSVVDRRSIDRHPLIQLAQGLADEYKKRQEEAQKKELRKKKEEEEAKIKSPPRKKKNFSLYQK